MKLPLADDQAQYDFVEILENLALLYVVNKEILNFVKKSFLVCGKHDKI